ncbi:DUF1499 domain-containing protein [Salinibius halmophilus]|uniref:DUF1499 domain-containing protein n=1 Tax=Salinibius halmophilus TaxID=1853216 RepID=UPI000E6645F5|nr:DUF1499 domain-containing protein [Salinibius halmophilus]
MFWKILLTLVVLFVVFNVLLLVWQNNRKPALGVQENGELAPLSNKPNCVSSFAEGERAVAPLKMAASVEQTKAAIESALKSLGNVDITQNDGTYIRAVATTKLMRYKDDIELLIDEASQQVHYRSASRAGYSDMGVNKTRYETFAKHYNEAIK